MDKYLKNPYIIIGLVGLGFYFWKRNQILKAQPNAEKTIEELSTDSEDVETDNFSGIPDKLKRDTKEMDKQTLKRTIITNQKMLKRARMSDKKRNQIKLALKYLKQEYKIKK
jgi:hypothetical protein